MCQYIICKLKCIRFFDINHEILSHSARHFSSDWKAVKLDCKFHLRILLIRNGGEPKNNFDFKRDFSWVKDFFEPKLVKNSCRT